MSPVDVASIAFVAIAAIAFLARAVAARLAAFFVVLDELTSD